MVANILVIYHKLSSLRGLLSAHIVAPTILRNHQRWREEIGKPQRTLPVYNPPAQVGHPCNMQGASMTT